MKHCTNCGTPLNDEVKFCPSCGTEQTGFVTKAEVKQALPAVVIVFCILTILGSVLGLIRGLFYEVVANVADNEEYWRGYAFAACHLGTLVAAIVMLTRKIWGFWMYVLFQLAYFGLMIFTLYTYSNSFENTSGEEFIGSIFIMAIFGIPSLVMLVLYIIFVRKHLK